MHSIMKKTQAQKNTTDFVLFVVVKDVLLVVNIYSTLMPNREG